MLLAVSADVPALVNDKSSDLIALYRAVASGDGAFFSTLKKIAAHWERLEYFVSRQNAHLIARHRMNGDGDLSDRKMATALARTFGFKDRARFVHEIRRNLKSKVGRMAKIESLRGVLSEGDLLSNMEGALKSAFYMHLRYLYNNAQKLRTGSGELAAQFFFLREYSYASMFRYNSRGGFNVPYGGISYNRKDLRYKIEKMKDARLRRRLSSAVIENLDFMEFFKKYPPQAGDFLFLDPPYDSDFSAYDQNIFGKAEQAALAAFLLNRCRSRFMLVIKSTDYILSLYRRRGLNIEAFGKKYMWTIKERNNRDVTHLMITNY